MGYKSILIGDPIARKVPNKNTYLEYEDDVKRSVDSIGAGSFGDALRTAAIDSTANNNKKKKSDADAMGAPPEDDFYLSGISRKAKQAAIKLYQLNTLAYEELKF